MVNTGDACTLTLEGGAADWSFSRKLTLPENVTLAKRGGGMLSLPEGAVPNLTVEEGGLTIVSRAEYGYPFYKFQLYGTGNMGKANARVNIAELVFLNGETDVTREYKRIYYDHTGTSYYNDPANALDGDVTTYFYDQRAQSTSTIERIHFEIEYDSPRKVTGYKWTYPPYEYAKSKEPHPTSWAIMGSDDNLNWTTLDYVEYQEADWTGWTTRTCTFPSDGDYVVTMAAGTALKVVGADVSDKVTTASETLALEKGAKVALSDGTQVASLALDADDAAENEIDNFVAAETGTLALTGTAERPPLGALPLKVPGVADATLERWIVTYNGVEVERMPSIKDGTLILRSTRGLMVIVK